MLTKSDKWGSYKPNLMGLSTDSPLCSTSALEQHWSLTPVSAWPHMATFLHAGAAPCHLGAMPSSSVLGALGLRSHSIDTTIQTSSISAPLMAPSLLSIHSDLPTRYDQGESSKASDPIVVAPGIPALKRSLVEQILGGKYVDLGELPPAKGFNKPTSSLTAGLDGQVVLLQAADLVKTKKLIPDLATWTQCFAIYTAVLVTKFPARAQSLLMYMGVIAKLSKKFKWPSWIIYDHTFRQEASATGQWEWSKIDGGIYAQCFTGMSLTAEGWCSICKSMDHIKSSCPYRSTEDNTGHKRPPPSRTTRLSAKRPRIPGSIAEPCRRWNRSDMDCPFQDACMYQHLCSKCLASDHAASKCKKQPPK